VSADEIQERRSRLREQFATDLEHFAEVTNDSDRYYRAFMICSLVGAALDGEDIDALGQVSKDYLFVLRELLDEGAARGARVVERTPA
jgi:hypothetical protein